MCSKVLILALVAALVAHVTIAEEFATISPATLKKLFDSVKPYSDLSNAFYSAKGLSLLGESQQNAQELCNLAKTKVDKSNLESIYYATSLASLAANCQLPAADFQAALTAGASSQNVADIYYYVFSAANLKSPIDVAKVSKNVVDGLKTDSAILNQAYALHIATLLKEQEKTFYANVEDIIEQADEVSGKYLQYEGGVGTTSLVLEGIFLLSDKVKQFPAKLDQARLAKFVNYLTSKRQATNIKSAFFLLRAALVLADNANSVPIALQRQSSISVLPTQATLVISLTDVLGRALKSTPVVEAESAKSQSKPEGGAALFAAKRAFTKSKEASQWELKLVEPNQAAAADFYTVKVNAVVKGAEKRFFLVQKEVEVKVTTLVDIVDIQIASSDRDASAQKFKKIENNQKLSEKLEGDQQSKFTLKFAVKEKSKGALIETHQAFVRFVSEASGRDIVFLAQASSGNQYSAEVDFSTNAKNFKHISGLYKVELVVSDSLIENPTVLYLADIKLKFADDGSHHADRAALFAKKPEIKHLFRQPETTPPKAVSSLFALLCLLPTVLMFLLWIKIGFNFSKLQFSVFAIVFHVALAAIFGLFYLYWTSFNMFTTLRWLAIIGGVAFLSGNQLLRSLASKEKTK